MKTVRWGRSRNKTYFPNTIHALQPLSRSAGFTCPVHVFRLDPLIRHTYPLRKDEFLGWGLGEGYDGCIGYKKERCNGVDTDAPNRPFPQDGIYTWDTPREDFSHIRYTEGDGDRVWMIERDRNYLARLFIAGANGEQENQDLSENRESAVKAAQEVQQPDFPVIRLSQNLRELFTVAQNPPPPAPAAPHQILFFPAPPPSIPQAYLCPITHDIMREPTVDREGHTFEMAAIEQWIEARHTCPISRTPLELADLAPNRALRDAIEEFLAANPALRPEAHVPAPAL